MSFDRAACMRRYYDRRAEVLNQRSKERHMRKRWTAWLLANLTWPVEPTPEIPLALPVRRPLLRLSK